jgi:hypothetical protein
LLIRVLIILVPPVGSIHPGGVAMGTPGTGVTRVPSAKNGVGFLSIKIPAFTGVPFSGAAANVQVALVLTVSIVVGIASAGITCDLGEP